MVTAGAGERIGRFRIDEAVASGGFSVVYRARDLRLDQDVAIKVLADNYAFDPDIRTRFADEARALRAVDSTSVVTVFDIGETESGQPYLVMNYADRGTLADRLGRDRPIGRREVARLVAFLADSLGAMHAARLIHRDVKPSNILLTSTGTDGAPTDSLLPAGDQLLLADFGLVKDLSAGSGYTAEAGSAGYAPPEQSMVGSRVDERSDVYGASAVMARVLTGLPADAGSGWVEALARSPHRELAAAIGRGLSTDPAKRQASMAEWRADLERGLEYRGGTTRSKGPRTSRLTRAMVGMVVLVLVLVLTAGLVGLWATRLGDLDPIESTTTGAAEPAGSGSSSTAVNPVIQPPSGLTAEVVGDSVRLAWTAAPATDGVNLFVYDNDGSRRRWVDWLPAGRDRYQLYRLAPASDYRFGLQTVVDGIEQGSDEVTVEVTTGFTSALEDGEAGTALRSFRSELCAVIDERDQVTQDFCNAGEPKTRWDLQVVADRTVVIASRSDSRCLRLTDPAGLGETRPIPLELGGCDEGADRFVARLNEAQGVHELHLVVNGTEETPDSEDWCLDVLGGSEQPGAPLVVFPCNGALNQRWIVNGL